MGLGRVGKPRFGLACGGKGLALFLLLPDMVPIAWVCDCNVCELQVMTGGEGVMSERLSEEMVKGLRQWVRDMESAQGMVKKNGSRRDVWCAGYVCA